MDVRSGIRDFIVDNFMIGKNLEDLNDSSSLLDLGIIDSTGILELVQHIEETFSFSIEDHELVPDNLDSIDKLVMFIQQKTGLGEIAL